MRETVLGTRPPCTGAAAACGAARRSSRPAARASSALAAMLLSGCVIHSTQPYSPSALTPETADAATASTNCFEAGTAAERLICAAPALGERNRAMIQALQTALRAASLFGRDALVADQRAFLLGLPGACHLPEAADAPPDLAASPCVSEKLAARAALLASWRPPAQGGNAAAQYLKFRISAGASPALGGAFCAGLAGDINTAVAQSGSADPAFMPGAAEIAGSHGPGEASAAGHSIAVDLRPANAFGSFALRARDVRLDGQVVLNADALGAASETGAANAGARFASTASQTGDYGAADVFTYQGRTLALLQDAWGFDTPAAPGEYAHAAAFLLAAGGPHPVCLFDTFQMPASGGVFDTLPDYTAWRAALAQMQASATPPLGVAWLRDQGQLRAEADWTVLHLPLVVIAQAHGADWTGWLRHRHDDVLDAMFAWGQKSPENKAVFDAVFGHLRGAAADLVRGFQQGEALSGAEAKEAAGLAVMELMYGATVTIAPDLGADTQAPGSAAGVKPRYPILASPN